MFTQVAIILLSVFIVASGLREVDYLNVGVGILVGYFAATTIYKLKTGR